MHLIRFVMTSEEIADLRALINQSRPPKDGMEIHFLRVLEGVARPCSPKETEWCQWVMDNRTGAPQHLSVANLPRYTEGPIIDIADSCTQKAGHQVIDVPAKQQASKKAAQEDLEKANSVLKRICANDFSCIREVGEQRNPFVFELLRHLIPGLLEKTQDREIRDRIIRAQRKIYEVEHNTRLPDGGDIVNFGGLHDLRTWNW